MSPELAEQQTRGWQARLHLSYASRNGKTVLANRSHSGPLLVQKPFYPEDDVCCHTYVIHPPGGIVGGDELTIDVQVEQDAHALITTPAATKFYRSSGHCAKQTQTIRVASGAALEWVPQETVYFNQSIVQNHTRIELNNHAKLIAWDIQCLGLPVSNEPFTDGHCEQRLEVYRNNRPLLLECNRLYGHSTLLTNTYGLHDKKAFGTLIATCDQTDLVDALRNNPQWNNQPALLAFGTFNGLLICRVLAEFSYQILSLFRTIWKIIRPAILNRHAIEPRIWNT